MGAQIKDIGGDSLSRPSKIDTLGIGAKVLALRKDLTCEEIADEINERYLPVGAEPITKMAVSRYCTAHGMTDMERNDISKDVTHFDSLAETKKVRDRVVRHANKLSQLMEDIKQDEEKLSELSSISNAYLSTLTMQQKMNKEVSRIQVEQLGVEKVRKVINLILSVLSKYPAVRAEVFEKVRESDVYETIRSV